MRRKPVAHKRKVSRSRWTHNTITMACRKNAYRGLQELSEYLEKHNEETERQRHAFEEKQREIWTSPTLLERCCLQWLSHGPHRTIRSGNNLASVAHRGCGGGCSKAHPKISLKFEGGVAIASVSHALDPFLQFFRDDVGAETMEEEGPLNYRLSGLLSCHHERIKRKFGTHLVSVDHKALAASQRAHERQLEREDVRRAAKKRKVWGEAAPTDLLESVLEICYNDSLGKYLDVADISWMRTSCKSMGRIAARLARDRMKAVRLSYAYTPAYSADNQSWRSADGEGFEINVASKPRPLCLTELQESIDWRYVHSDAVTTSRIDVYLDEMHSRTPEQNVFFEKCNHPLEVARYVIDTRQFRLQGEVHNVRSNVQNRAGMEGSLEYRVTSLNLGSFEDQPYSYGEINLTSIAFNFDDLLGVFVRRRLHKAKQEYNSGAFKKPADKAYVKALAKAAREAPGDARSFRGMEGWGYIYR